MLRTTVILCTIAAQVLAAPKPDGCIESCTTYNTHQTHEALIQQQTAALNELQQIAASKLSGLEFSRPGNWTEQNEYRTDGGRGRVFEEQGQVVTGPRRTQYYRKNYSSSSHGVNGVNTAASGLGGLGGIESTVDSQRLTGLSSGLGSVGHHRTYDEQRHSEIRQSSNRINSHSGRLEDFGERVDNTQQVLQQVPSVSGGGTWHTSDSWRTDGGRGVVHEEQGQVVNGPTKVKYYRQNYSSSYSSGDAGAVVPSVGQPNLDADLQQMHSQLDSFGREIHQTNVGHRSLSSQSQTAGNVGYVDEDLSATTNIRPISTVYVQNTQGQHHSTVGNRVIPNTVSNERYHSTRGETFQETESAGRDYSATTSHIDNRRQYEMPQTIHVVSRPRTTLRKSESHVYQESTEPQGQIVLTNTDEIPIDTNRGHLIRTPIHTNTNYRSFHSNGEVQGNRLTTAHSQAMSAEEIRQAQIRQSEILEQNRQRHNSYTNGNVEMINVASHQPAAVNRYEEKWSEGYRSHSTVPQQVASSQILVGQHANYAKSGQTGGQMGSYTGNSHNSHSSHYESGSHFYEGFRTKPDQLVTGSLSLGQIGQTGADCDQGVTTSEQYQYGSIHQRKFKREAEPGFHGRNNDHINQHSQQVEDLTQQTAGFDDFYQQHSGNLQHGQHSQQTEDLTQQIGGFGDDSQHTTGNLEFGQRDQHSGRLELGQETQQTEDLTQQTSGFGHYSQQTSGNLEFGHQQQNQHSGKLEFGQETQQTEDMTQQTSGFGDYSQQTSGNLELGHQQQEQHSGKLEFGPESQQADTVLKPSVTLDFNHETDNPWVRAHEAVGHTRQTSEDLTQQSEDLTQQSEDLTQQTTGHHEFGQQQQLHSGKLEVGQETQQTEDLTQQTGGFDDFTQQTSGNLEFGQQNQQPEDLTQQTSDHADHTFGNLEVGQHHHQHSGNHELGHEHHQHSGNHEFGHEHHQHSGNHEFGHEHHQHSGNHGSDHHHQHSGNHEPDHHHQHSRNDEPDHHHQHSGNHESGHQHHQHSGNHEFGHRHHQHSGNDDHEQETQQTEDLTQQTGGFGDFSQQTSENLEFGQQHQHGKREFGQETQQTEDLSQQTGGFDHFTQQTSGNLELGQQHQHGQHEFGQETQQTEDMTQQTSGNLEFGQQHQHGNHEFGQETQQTEDLSQQTGGFDHFTQQTSGNLEFGQQHQHGKHEFGQETQQTEDLTQQTGGFGDFTQQTSGNLEFGQQHHQIGQETQQTEDLTQQTGEFGDFTQQTSGNLEFGQQHQHGQETQQTEDLTQQTGGFDDFTQQTSGNLEFGQQHQQGKHQLGQETQQTEDLTQQTGGFDDFTQQTSGNLEFGQQHQQGKHQLGQETQQTEDLTQQTGGFDDFTQQTSGNLEFGQHHQHGQETQQTEDLTQQTGGFGDFTQQTSGNLEFGKQHQLGQETQQTEDLTQQTGDFGDFTQQTSGNLEFGQQHQHNQETQQTEDLTQQTGDFGDFTQQTSGNLEFGQQHHHGKHGLGQETQQTEDLTQQTGGFGDFSQQTSGNLEFGQQHHHGKHEFGQETQQTEDLTQKPGGFNDLTQHSSGNLGQEQQQTGNFEFGVQTTTTKPQRVYQPGVKGGRRRIPAPKPTLRSGRRHGVGNDAGVTEHKYPEPEDVPGVLGIDEPDTQEPQNQGTINNNKPNDQWHQNHHPGDLTNSENHQSHQVVNHQIVHEEHMTQTVRKYPTKSGRRPQQMENIDSRPSRQSSLAQGENSEPDFKLEPRIVEAYGGAGAYDVDHNDDLFSGAKHNPSATLPPNPEGIDPWVIVEHPVERDDRRMVYAPPTVETTTEVPEEPTTTPAPSFWSRVGNKLSNTYEKAKEKASSIFGK